jgi:hypothetical protein
MSPLVKAWIPNSRAILYSALLGVAPVVALAAGVAQAAHPGGGLPNGLAAAQDIRDIRPPFHIPDSWLWPAAIVGCCVLAALVVAVWRWRQRHVAAMRKLAHELALERLMEARMLLEPGQAREFSIAVSDIVRFYIEERFDIQAAHRTTLEFLRDCLTQGGGSLEPYREQLEKFLRFCDLAKFARWVLSVPEMEAMLASAIVFVTATAPPGAGPDRRVKLVSQPKAARP